MAGYGSDDGFAAWLSANGHTLPATAPAPAVLRQRGSDYIDGLYGKRFSGAPTAPLTQERAWPRTGASIHGADIPADAVPTAVINASYAAAWREGQKPGSLSVAVTPARQVKRVKAGSTEVEFASADASVASAVPVLSEVEGLLAPLLAATIPAVFTV